MTQITGTSTAPTFVPPTEVKTKEAEVKTDTLVAQAETPAAKPTEAEVKANAAALAQVDQKA